MLHRTQPGREGWRKRVGWLVLIWLLSVAALGVVAAALKVIMRIAGLAT